MLKHLKVPSPDKFSRHEKDISKEVLEIKREIGLIKEELGRVAKIEKSLAYHELVLTKKVRDVNELNEKLENCLNQEHLKQIRKGLHKVEHHEEMLFESARYIKELIRELEKVRQSHLSHAKDHSELIERHKRETDENVDDIHSRLNRHEEIHNTGKKEVMDRVGHVERDLLDRMSQIEYQNKLIMRYLKRIDELIFKQ